ncbi:MAG: hypothetical protein K8W52_02675 [Deltaproteobacteria bacterium]|nr:hypothetical protein [Deltaproteobacteria bacterium]
MRLLTVAVAALLSTALAASARAECGSLHPRISPPTGVHLPVNPHVYLFIDAETWATRDQWLRIEQDRKGVPFDATVLDRRDDRLTIRLDIHTDVARDLTIQYGPYDGWSDPAVDYVIEHHAADDQVRLVASSHIDHHWSCSFTDAIALDLIGNAVAYRLEWARSAAELAAHPMGRAWLWPDPADPDLGDLDGYVAPDQILIGHESCRGMTIPDGALVEPRATRLVALFADGHEATIDTGVLQIGNGTVRLPEGTEAPTVAPPPPPQAPVELELTLPWSALVAAAASGACAALGIVLALRSRRRRGPIGSLGA